MDQHQELKYLIEQNARHLAHLQRRIDMLHATLEAFLPMLVSAATVNLPPDSPERAKVADAFLEAFRESRDQKIARLSEVPFVGIDPPSDEPS